jgi:hypothetical protein
VVLFVNRDTTPNTVLATAPVGLVSSTDPTVGTATATCSLSIGASGASPYHIGVIVTNYYTRNSSSEDAVVCVALPLTSAFITGGGYLKMTNSSGIKAGDPGTRNNFGFNVKYNNSGTSLQGQINTIIRRMESDGLLHVYQIKGNSMTSLASHPMTPPSTTNPSTAVFNGKANIQDITNPLNIISVDGNATLQVNMTDTGNSQSDQIAITVWNKSGGLWFASYWNGTQTVQQVLAGGNLVVH